MMASANADGTELHHSIIVDDSGNDLMVEANATTEDYLKNSVAGAIDPAFDMINGGLQQRDSEETDAQERLSSFWQKQMEEIQNNNDFKTQDLPLARIKKIMKMDEDVKMISAEAPLLFSKAAQIFITELSLRAWVHTEESKRRTLQRNDIATAISKFDQFDFLIDIVPREELKTATAKRTYSGGGNPDAQQLVFMANSTPSANNVTSNISQSSTQLSGLRSGQLLIAQQSQSGQPLTLTPINVEGAQVLQVVQPQQQAQVTPQLQQQTQQQQQQQQQQQFASGVILNAPSTSGNRAVLETQPAKQVQQVVTTNVPSNEQGQLQQSQTQQQSMQAILQQLIGNISAGPGEMHTLQINSQGQLQIVKVTNQQSPEQAQSGILNQRQPQQSGVNQLFDISSAIDSNSGQPEMGTVYVTPEQ